MRLAPMLNAEIIGVDSMQVYRRMDIGTAKPGLADRAAVAHHLIDVVEPSESFSVSRYVESADAAIADITGRGHAVLAVAGTPLYLMGLMFGLFEGPAADVPLRRRLRRRADEEGTAVLHRELADVDPQAADRIHPNDYKRIERALEVWHITGRPLSDQQVQWSAESMRYPATLVGIRRNKDDNSRRINARVKRMIADGLVDEVRSLLSEPAGLGEPARQALGYAEILAHLDARMPLADAVERIKINTRRLAKHQRTWFRKFTTATWIDVTPEEPASTIASRVEHALTGERD